MSQDDKPELTLIGIFLIGLAIWALWSAPKMKREAMIEMFRNQGITDVK